ncbi:MAG: hypothetical protein ABR600_01915 [Actinomycetota bacterium]
MKAQRLSRSAVAFIGGVIAAGLATIAVRMPELSTWTTVDLLAVFGLVAATIAGESFTMKVPFGSETKNISLTESAYATALLLGVRPGVLTVAAALGVTLAYTARGAATHKVAFNASSFAIAVTAAEVAFSAVHPASPLGATSLAMLAFFAVNSSTVVGVIALATRQSFTEILRPIARVEALHSSGNLALGGLGALVWTTAPAPVSLVVMPVVVLGVYALAAARVRQPVSA